MQRHGHERFGQRVAQGDGASGKRVEVRQRRARTLQLDDHLADGLGGVADHGHAVLAGRALAGQRALHVGLHRRRDVGERGDFGHRERAVHRVDGAQQLVGDRLRAAGAAGIQPGVDRFQMSRHFGLEDFEQHRVDREATGLGVVGGFDLDAEGRGGLGFRRRGFGHHRHVRRRFDHGRHGRGELHRLVEHFLACRHPVGKLLDAFQVGVDRFALQRRTQQRQGVERILDQRHHGRAGRAGAVQHAVERAFDLPAELAQGLGAHQAAAALEGVEHAADGPQLLHVVGLLAPGRQDLLEVADFFLELFQEDFADLVVDFVTGTVEARDDRQAGHGRLAVGRRRCGGGRGRCDRRSSGRRLDQVGRQLEGRRELDLRLGFRRDHRGRRRFGYGSGRHFGHGRRHHHGRHYFGRTGHGNAGSQRRQVFGRQRPVAQRLEVLLGDVQDLVALGATVAQRFEVILQAGQRVRQAVHLLAIGHAVAAQQLAFGEAADRAKVLGRIFELEDAKRTRDFFQQARHVGQLGVVPMGFHEGHEALAGLREVRDGFLHQHFEHLAGFVAGQDGFVRGRRAGGAVVGVAQAGDLVVERGFDVKQGPGDVEQARLVGHAFAAHQGVDGVALVLDHTARHAQAQHAQGVGDAIKRLHLVFQRTGRRVGRAQVQVERVLDAQQVFLDGHGHRGQQGAVAAAEAAAGVRQLGFAGQVLAQAEHGADLADAAMVGGSVGNEIKQLARQLQRRIAAESGVAALGQPLDLAFDLGQRLLERLGGLEGILGERVERAGGDPEQAACVLGVGDRHQLLAHVGEVTDGGGAVVVLEPAQQRALEQVAQRVGTALELVGRQRLGRAAGRGRQRTRQVGREQHRFGQALLAARLAKLVEQRQQHDGNVAVAALQALEVVGQLHDAAHQRGIAAVALGDAVVHQRARQLLHLLGHHGGAVEFNHAQRSLHLVQVVHAGLELAGILAFLDVRLQRLACLAQRFVKLGFDPSQRGEIVVLLKPHAEVLSRHGRRVRRPHRRISNDPTGPDISPAA